MTRILAAILSILVLTASVVLPGFAPLGSSSVSVEITHSHAHGDEEHSHAAVGMAVADSANLPEDSHNTRHEENGTPHSHTILVGGPAAVALPQNIEFDYVTQSASVQTHAEKSDPPVDRSLGSIFRPPIQA